MPTATMKLPDVSRITTAVAAAATSTSPAIGTCSAGGGGSCSPYQYKISSIASSLSKPPRVLAASRGSGNFGESGAAAFYILEELPPALTTMSHDPAKSNADLQRVDLDVGPHRLAFTIDNVLSHEEADALAACAEAVLQENGHSRLAPGIHTPPGMRVNEAAHWYPSHELAPKFFGSLFDRFRHLVPTTLDGLPMHDHLSEKVAQFKYGTGDRFNRHIDGLFPGQGANPNNDGVDEWTGVVSGMSMLFYLNDGPNDGLEGGETRLWTADGSRFIDVTPKKGRVLFFRRGSRDAVLHAGMPITGPVPKYMALINLAYGNQTGRRPLIS